MNSPNPMNGADPKHRRAVDADVDENALVASGPQPKHGAFAALSVGAVGAGAAAVVDGAVGPKSGSEGFNV